MKIFIVGMPQSGRTTVAKSLGQSNQYCYIDAFSWVKSMFRDPKIGEPTPQYEEEFHHWFTNRIKTDPSFIVNNIFNCMDAYDNDVNFIIDGITSPRDFTRLFDINQDIVVFLNRLDNTAEYKDYENIGVSVIRDYCFWLSSADLLPKNRWIEFNFKVPGNNVDVVTVVKKLGNKNTVFIVNAINSIVPVLKEMLNPSTTLPA
jgi:hypothetical protein